MMPLTLREFDEAINGYKKEIGVLRATLADFTKRCERQQKEIDEAHVAVKAYVEEKVAREDTDEDAHEIARLEKEKAEESDRYEQEANGYAREIGRLRTSEARAIQDKKEAEEENARLKEKIARLKKKAKKAR
jgi:chromosome segregation ATPase